MTIIQIPASEKETMERICAELDTKITFYTQEHNSEMLTVELDTDSPSVMYALGKAVEAREQLKMFLKTKAFNQELKF